MAKYFLYSHPNLYDTGAVRGGAITGSTTKTWTESSSAITNVDRVADQNIGSVISSVAQYDTIRIDMGSGFSCDAIAFYHTAADTNDLEIYASNSASTFTTGSPGSDDHIQTISADFTAGAWQITDITITSKRYIYIYNGTANEWDYCSEIMLGTKYTFDRNYDLGGKFGKAFGVTNMKSYGGIEYSHKRHDGKETWDWEWTRLTNAQMNSLVTLRDAVEGSRFKFLYYDGTAWNWVRMSDKSLQKKEIAYQTYNTSIQLIQQLA